MNANSLPQTQVIKDWLNDATRQLSKIGINSAKLDSELILAHTLGKSRTYLHVHNDEILNTQIVKAANDCLEQRLRRVPIAYIVGYKEFYGRQFLVTPATLIPRPESETIIDILKDILTPNSNSQIPIANLIDVGTGSGCLGITAKLEFPALNVTLADISADALKIAKQNAKKLSADVIIIQSDLLQNYYDKPDIIIANLPYVDLGWDRSPETNHEPRMALFAKNHGVSIITTLIDQAHSLLAPGGFLIIEADPCQHSALVDYAKKYIFTVSYHLGYIVVFKLNR